MVSIADVNLEYVKSLPCKHFEDRHLLPEEPGVYFTAFEVPDFRVIYIGQTVVQGFKKRWSHHELLSLLRQLKVLGIDTWIYCLTLSGWSEMDVQLMESVLIKKMYPTLNTEGTGKTLGLSGDRWRDCSSLPPHAPTSEQISSAISRIKVRLEYMYSSDLQEVLDILGYRGKFRSKVEAVAVARHLLGSAYVEGRYPGGIEPPSIELSSVDVDVSSLGSRTIRELRTIAAKVGVNRYSYMTKTELAQAISKLLAARAS